MLTINAEIKSDGKRLDGTYNVKLRFTIDRKMRRQGTSLFATPSDLTKDLRIKQSSPLRQEVDSLIRSYLERCAKLQIELNRYTIDEVMDYLNGEREIQLKMKTFRMVGIALMAVLMCANLSSCGEKKSKSQINSEINNLNNRIRTLKEEIPIARQYGNREQAERMEDNLKNYQIQVDELNRQLVK